MANTQTLRDDFEDNGRDNAKWGNAYSSVTTFAETGGTVVFTLANGTAGSNYAGYNSFPNAYDFTGSYIAALVSTVPNVATSAQVGMKVYLDGSNILQFVEFNGTLHFQKTVAGVNSDVASVTYSATNHRWWRLRENGGTTYWDTSPDGRSWNQQTSLANPFAVTSVTVEFFAGTFQSEASPGTAVFDNFNYITTGAIENHLTVGDGMSRAEVAN